MTDITRAKRIGYRQAFKAITIGLAVAYLIIALMAGPFWLFEFDYAPTLIFAAIVLYGTGYLFGGLAGKFILIKRYPSVLIGLISGFLIIWSATFVGSLIGFFNEGLPNRSPISEPFEDYILKPIFMVSFWGFIPIVAIGIWYGWSIKRRAELTNIA
jgi:hypothetical protein